MNDNLKESNVKKVDTSNKSIKLKKLVATSIILSIVLIYVIYSLYKLISQPTDVFMVEEGKVSEEKLVEGYVIREETVIKGENYKNGMVTIKNEGERVAKNDTIFRYYSTNEEQLVKKIEELDSKIDEAKNTDSTIPYSSDIKVIEKDIDNKVYAIHSTNDIQKINEYKSEISKLITKKMDIIGKASPSNSYMKQLINERNSYVTKLNSESESVISPTSGMVSYKVDGLESVLTTSNFGSYSREFFDNLKLKTGQVVATNNECGKVVNNYKCNIATILKNDELNDLKQDDSLYLRLSNGDEIPATVEYLINKEDNDVLVVFKIEKDVEELINYRKISFDIIFWSYSGLKVPNTSIVEEDGKTYVIRNRAGYLDKILVKIKRKNDTYSIVTNYSTEELKELGYTSTEIRNIKTITLYDEILTRPSETDLQTLQ